MNRISKNILTVIFLLLIFLVGLGTAWNVKQADTDFSAEKGFAGLKGQIEDVVTDQFERKTDWINVNGLFQKLLGVTIIRDPEQTVYKLKNGQIMYNLKPRDMTDYAGYIEELNTALREKDIQFIYVQIPFKIKDDSYMPPGTHACGNENADQLVRLLREKKINTMDLRDDIEEQGLDWSSLFYKTDHHWKAETAFWAADLVMKRLREDYGYEINEDYYKTENFDLKEYDQWFLGSLGRRTGIWYDGLDDFTLYDPKFKTDFTFWGSSKSGEEVREGSFWDSMYSWKNMEVRADFERNTYNTYLGKEYALFDIKNHRVNNGLRMLMIRESFSDALAPFLSLNAEEIVGVDLRKYHKKDILWLCEKYDIDLVMIDYNPSAFSKKQFDFFDRGL